MNNAVQSEMIDYLDYIDQVFDRSRKLIQTQVWQGIKEQRLDSWIGCLKNHDSELLGAYLLDNLCFRSKDQFNSLLDVLFVNAQIGSGDNSFKLIESIQKKNPSDHLDIKICLAPVIDEQSPPTKSGPYILRLAQRRYDIHSDWLAWPRQLSNFKKLEYLFFIDDFCGSGKQFMDFAKSISLNEIYERDTNIKISYFVATAHQSGIEDIKNAYPYIEVKYAERLTGLNTVLSDECFKRYQVEGFKECVLKQYENLVRNTDLPRKGKFANGFGDLGLAYAFAHATPNNTLPIFWYETDNWTPLLDR